MAKVNTGAALLSLCLLLACSAGGTTAADVDVEGTVRTEVENAIKSNPGVGAALIRLVFHDCWVNGCDGSVLLDQTPSGSNTEKKAINNMGLDGFSLVDTIKSKLGNSVSCADIVVFAGRDAARYLSGGKIAYTVPSGRKDGIVSSAAAADAILPQSTFEFQQLKDNFAKKNFTQEELVILSGAHSIGVSHLSSFQDRLNGTTATPINDSYKQALVADIEAQKNSQNTQDPIEKNNIRDMSLKFQNDSGYDTTGVNTAAKGALDNSYYHANLQNRVLFKSDWVMRTDIKAGGDMAEYMNNATKWNNDFAATMVKLSKLPAEGSTHYEIRKNCRVTNQNQGF
ncbi:peroxidase 5-like [Triticum dicoccoides]|uniref:peroxidase 5-like n=1 Tax=Triticum dicoccoides TaxID=85692 RepID=UPI000E7A6437|nr:peroxidase 5-like [Triticum dicoccoides]